MITLWPHQEEAVTANYESTARRKLHVIPTGGGKSYVLAKIAATEALFDRVLCLAHVDRLIQQNENSLRKLLPEADIGVYCSNLKRFELGHQITVASVQSIYKRLHEWNDVATILIDEAHRITPIGGKMYRAVLDYYKDAGVVGLTATPFRQGTGYLHKGEHAIFDELTFETPYERLVAEGYLVSFAEKGSELAYDTSKLHIQAGEFKQDELDALVDYPKTVAIVDQFIARSQGRNHKLVFAINVRHCEIIKEIFRERRIEAEIIHGKINGEERQKILCEFEAGLTEVLINCNVLTTGYDCPSIDCIGLFRPIASVVLFIQCLGRGTRIAEGKEDCLVLDYGGNISRHGHFSKPEVREKTGKGALKNCPECGERHSMAARHCFICGARFNEMFKACPKCEYTVDVTAQTCSRCGYQWPVNEKKLDENGETILPNKAIWLDVSDWKFHVKYHKEGDAEFIIVSYVTVDHGTIQEYIFPERIAARPRFVTWWRLHAKGTIPETAREAVQLCKNFTRPRRIKVIRNGKYYHFLSREFFKTE